MAPVFMHQMPVINSGAGSSNAPQQQQRTTFRPPWVKEGPEPLPLPTAPWTLARTRQKAPEAQEAPVKPNLKPIPRKSSVTNNVAAENSSESSAAAKTEPAPVRKTSKITIIPSKPAADAASPKENGHDVSNSKPIAKTQKAAETKSKVQSQAKQIPIEIKSTTKPKQEEQKQKSSSKQPEEVKESKTESKPPQPPAPPMPPPPMPNFNQTPVTAEKAEKLDALRNRPRKRPDWGALMKEVEGGHKNLKHVKSNDRSSPLLPKIKVKNQFMYESESPNVHNLLLKEIQSGIKLKRVQTNDRSRPQLDGLRKFRRQLTIEEQIQKAETEEQETEPDELDDIDKVRDDLQSTKQMLALELRNKEAMERENKKLLTRLLNLEVELEKERATKNATEAPSSKTLREEDEQEKKKLRLDLEEAQQVAEEIETKFHDTVSQLDMARADLEEALRKNQALERKLRNSFSVPPQGEEQPIRKQPSSKRLAAKESTADMPQVLAQDIKQEEEEESEYEEETETESSEEDEEDSEALREKRAAREMKLLATKLKSFKDKEDIARKERKALRDQLKKQQKILKEEKKKYKVLQKEVDKMANLMKEDEDEEDDENEEDEESEESESESESEESDDESDGDLPPDTPAEKKKQNLTDRAKTHENCLAALRKGNYMLKANIDKLKDDLFKQKEMSLTLQEDLNSVLAELG